MFAPTQAEFILTSAAEPSSAEAPASVPVHVAVTSEPRPCPRAHFGRTCRPHPERRRVDDRSPCRTGQHRLARQPAGRRPVRLRSHGFPGAGCAVDRRRLAVRLPDRSVAVAAVTAGMAPHRSEPGPAGERRPHHRRDRPPQAAAPGRPAPPRHRGGEPSVGEGRPAITTPVGDRAGHSV